MNNLINNDIYIIGAGTYGEVMYELAILNKYNVIGFFDDDPTKIGLVKMGKQVIGSFSELDNNYIKNKNFIVAIGNNTLRLKICDNIIGKGGNIPTLIHPSAIISPSAKIGKGVYIQADAYIWSKTSIEDYCIISPKVVVAHHSHIEKACLVSTASVVGASIKIHQCSLLGIGSIIVTGVSEIGKNTIIGAGAVVLKDVNERSVMVGNPARLLRKNIK